MINRNEICFSNYGGIINNYELCFLYLCGHFNDLYKINTQNFR